MLSPARDRPIESPATANELASESVASGSVLFEPVLHPKVALATANIHDIAVLRDGTIACKTAGGIELFDGSLAPTGTSPAAGDGTIVELPDGRLVLGRKDTLSFHVGQRGEALTKVESSDDLSLFSRFVPTERGFLALAFNGFVVDDGGERRVVKLEGFTHYHGGVPWRGGAALFAFEGIALVGPDGTELRRTTARSPSYQLACADMLVAIDSSQVVVLDAELEVIATIEARVSSGEDLVAFRDGVVLRSYDEATNVTTFLYWRRDGGEQWSVRKPGLLAAPRVVGDRVVLVHYDGGVWIVDGDGTELGHVATKHYCGAVAALGDGIAISERETFGVVWWRPDGSTQQLEHDSAPETMRALSDGRLVTSDAHALLLWDGAGSAPERARVACPMPLEVPLVVQGSLLRVLGPGFFAIRTQNLTGQAQLLSPEAAWRLPLTRDEASTIAQALASRTHEGSPPSFEELAFVLGTTARQLSAAIRARKTALVPPRALPGFEYLGSFASSGALTVSDPCYLGKRAAPGFSLWKKVVGHDGLWHVFVRPDASDPRRNAELVTIHANGFDAVASEGIAMLGVDAGLMGVFDGKCPKPDLDKSIEEGTVAGQGAMVSSGYGDGMYPLFVGTVQGKVAKIRVHFTGEDAELDRSVLSKPQEAATPYSPKTTYVAGDAIAHPKFGTGTVVRLGTDGKIDVRFPDGIKTLVHARK